MTKLILLLIILEVLLVKWLCRACTSFWEGNETSLSPAWSGYIYKNKKVARRY